MVTVTWQVKPVQIGPQHWQTVNKQTQSLLMSTTMKRMSIYSIAIMEKNPGWAWMTNQQRVTSLGRIAEKGTLQRGPGISQTISTKKIVHTHLVWNTTMNGMTCSAAIVISTLARKVWDESIFIKNIHNRVNTCMTPGLMSYSAQHLVDPDNLNTLLRDLW